MFLYPPNPPPLLGVEYWWRMLVHLLRLQSTAGTARTSSTTTLTSSNHRPMFPSKKLTVRTAFADDAAKVLVRYEHVAVVKDFLTSNAINIDWV